MRKFILKLFKGVPTEDLDLEKRRLEDHAKRIFELEREASKLSTELWSEKDSLARYRRAISGFVDYFKTEGVLVLGPEHYARLLDTANFHKRRDTNKDLDHMASFCGFKILLRQDIIGWYVEPLRKRRSW